MKTALKRSLLLLLMFMMVVTLMPGLSWVGEAYAAEEPAAIQDTYVLDGVTYYDLASPNFAVDASKFIKDMFGTRTSKINLGGQWADDDYETSYYDQSEADLWLQVAALTLTDCTPNGMISRDVGSLYNAAVKGSSRYEEGSDYVFDARRYDVESKPSLKAAEDWVFQKTFGGEKDFGYFKDDTAEQLTLVTAAKVDEKWGSTVRNTYTIAAYFTNFRVFALIPSDEGVNYVTELITDTLNSQSTTASTVKNLTSVTVTGSQSVSNSITASVSNSVYGSESYTKSNTKKIGASYKFTDAFSVSGEVSWTEGEAFSTGWGSSDTLSKTKSANYTVSLPMAPYTQAMITQTDTTSVYLTRYNCPIAILYDVTVVGYQTGVMGDGILHTSGVQIHVDGEWISIDRDAVFSFSDPMEGARGDLDSRIKKCEKWSDMDDQGLRWHQIVGDEINQFHLTAAAESIAAVRSHVPMSSTGAAYTQTLNVVASEVSGLMATHPLNKVKIAEPNINIVSSDEVSYHLFDYFTANMKVGDYSYANYLNLVGTNRFDVPYYGFSKDSGYWIITDKQGVELDPEDSPVLLEKDPVSKNWRYTAVRPGTCYMVYRIFEDVYTSAERPDDPITNADLAKTAALEIIVTENETVSGHVHNMVKTKRNAPTCTELGNIEYYTCTECEGIFRDKNGEEELSHGDLIIPALGHDWTEWDTVTEPTEDSEGVESRFCRNDPSHTQERSIPALPHKHVMVKTAKVLPTCTEDGNIMYYSCSVCDRYFTDAEGSHEIDVLDTVLTATGHTEQVIPGTPATCEGTGLTEGKKCAVCGETLVAQDTIEALGHDWGEWVVTQEATALEEGTETRTCLRDGSHTETRPIPKLEIIVSGVARIYGSNRFATSLKVADGLKELLSVDKFDTVIMAYGHNYADALAGSYLSCLLDAPILLVDSAEVNIGLVQTYIESNLEAGGKIYILGGTGVVPDAAVQGLDGYDIQRLSGKTRYETNIAILEEAAKYEDADEIIVASGAGYADSLSAAATGKPILLVTDTLQDSQKEYLESLEGPLTFDVIGGTGAVSESMMDELAAFGSANRTGGKSRYETSVNVASKFFDKPESGVLAYGLSFPDGLCGGVLAYALGGPLILTENNSIQAAEAYAGESGMSKGFVLGGPALISDDSAKAIYHLAEGAEILVK